MWQGECEECGRTAWLNNEFTCRDCEKKELRKYYKLSKPKLSTIEKVEKLLKENGIKNY